MDSQSLTSLILLIVFFFVVPTLMKFLGKYTLNSKGEQNREEDPGEILPPEEMMPGHPKVFRPDKGIHDTDRPEISKEPINPKWF